jgi:hypothetical protein
MNITSKFELTSTNAQQHQHLVLAEFDRDADACADLMELDYY